MQRNSDSALTKALETQYTVSEDYLHKQELQKTTTSWSFLDWEKAFDKVDREEMFNAVERMEADPQLIKLVNTLDKNTQCKVDVDGYTSDWQTQRTGIIQGCPLSPYLFLIVMTVMFFDVHQELNEELLEIGDENANDDVDTNLYSREISVATDE